MAKKTDKPADKDTAKNKSTSTAKKSGTTKKSTGKLTTAAKKKTAASGKSAVNSSSPDTKSKTKKSADTKTGNAAKPERDIKGLSSAKKKAKEATAKRAAKIKINAVKEVEVVSPSKKVKKIKGYAKKDLVVFKDIILGKREEIIEQLENLKEQMMDPTTGQYVNENSPYSLHMAEQGTDAQEREKLYLWAQRENKFLGYLEDALQRIENGTFGICIDCIDEPQKLCPTCPLIPKERLTVVPHTQHCVQIKQKMTKK